MALSNDFWLNEAEIVFQLTTPIVEEITELAMTDAVKVLIDLGFDFDSSFVNEAAVQFAHNYSFELITGITTTSRNFVSGTVEDWIKSGESIDTLFETLAPMFGDVRAEMIGVTEVTRIFADANREVWSKSGYVRKVKFLTAFDDLVCPICAPLNGEVHSIEDKKNKPPLHTKCRCFEVPEVTI